MSTELAFTLVSCAILVVAAIAFVLYHAGQDASDPHQ